MKRAALFVVFCLMAQPLWADYGLSNVATKQIDRGQAKEQTQQTAVGEIAAPASTNGPDEAVPERASSQEPTQVKKTVFYPYTIHISSWQTNKDALVQYKKKYQKLDGVFITKIDLGSTGIWYRIDAGAFSTVNEAEKRMKDLQAKGVIDTEAFIGSSVPLAIELKVLPDRDQAQKMKDKLRSDGIVAYIIKESDSAYRVLTGAFPNRNSGGPALDDLSALGLQAKITKR